MNKSIDKTPIPLEIERVFEHPPLMIGERARAYNTVRDALINAIRPQNYIEWLLLKQAADLYWETIRLGKQKAALVAMSWREALGQLLESILEGDEEQRRRGAQEKVNAWFGSSDAQDSVQALLRKHGFDEDTVNTHAMAIRWSELEIIDRRLERVRISQMATLREIEHYRVAGTWQRPSELIQIVDAAVSAIPIAPAGEEVAAVK
jgi:hypothetical protein